LLECVFRVSVEVLRSQGVIAGQSARYQVNDNSGKSIQGQLDYPFHFVDRSVYDGFWLKQAQAAGAEFRAGEKLTTLAPSGSQMTTNTGQILQARFIFGADGVGSKVRRTLAHKKGFQNRWRSGLATALEVIVRQPSAPQLPESPSIYFGYVPWGYAWCFPRGNLRLLGICGLNAKAGKTLKSGFFRFLASVGIAKNQIRRLQSHALPHGNYLIPPGGGQGRADGCF
jgi:flavin-dependent dehydrogenase